MGEEIHESLLDRHYKKQLRTLNKICAVHSLRTDFAICNKWLEVFDRAPKKEKYARNCLMLLMYSQMAEVGQLGKPFVDIRNCTKDLETVLQAYHGQWYDADHPRAAEWNKIKATTKLKQLEKRKPVSAEQTAVAEKSSNHCELCNRDLKTSAASLPHCMRSALAMSDDCVTATSESPHLNPPMKATPDLYCKICCIRWQNAPLLDDLRTWNGMQSEHIKDASYLLLEQRLEILHLELFHTRHVGYEQAQHVDPNDAESFGSWSAHKQPKGSEGGLAALTGKPLSNPHGNTKSGDLQRLDCLNVEGRGCQVVVMEKSDT